MLIKLKVPGWCKSNDQTIKCERMDTKCTDDDVPMKRQGRDFRRVNNDLHSTVK